MKGIRVFFISLFFLSFLTLNYAQSLSKTSIKWQGKNVEVASDYIVVKLNKDITIAQLNNVIVDQDISLEEPPDKLNIARLNVKESNKTIPEIIDDLSRTNIFEFVEPDLITRISLTPNDSYYSNQYALPKVSAPQAWDITTGSSSKIIGILDTGIPLQNGNLSHEDLQNSSRILLGTDETNEGDGVVKDEQGHGTHVAGICGAETNNSTGISGMNWQGKLRIYQLFGADGFGSASWFYDAVIDAVNNGCNIINYSGGVTSPASSFVQAIQYANNHDVLIVAAAGELPSTTKSE